MAFRVRTGVRPRLGTLAAAIAQFTATGSGAASSPVFSGSMIADLQSFTATGSGLFVPSGGGGGLNHNDTFLVTGSNFGTKSNQVPAIWEHGQDADGSVPTQYSECLPNASTNAAANMKLRAAPYKSFTAPNPYTQKIMVGGHWDSDLAHGFFGGWNVGISSIYTRPAGTFWTYWRFLQRCATNWNFTLGSPVDNNFKNSAYCAGSGMYNTNNYWYTAQWVNVNSPSASVSLINDTNLPSPDQNNHTVFWGGINNPFNAANGWIEVELIAKWSAGSPNGIFRYLENNDQAMDYLGSTDPWYSGAGTRTESLGGYGRAQHDGAGTLTNERGFAEVYHDRGSSPGRWRITNNATYGASTEFMTVPYESWSDTACLLRLYKAHLTSGTKHLHLRDEQLGNQYKGTIVVN